MNIQYVDEKQFPNRERVCNILVVKDAENPLRVVPTESWQCRAADFVWRYEVPSQLTAKAVNVLLDRIAPAAERMARCAEAGDKSSDAFVEDVMLVGRIKSDYIMDELDWDDPSMWVEWRDQ